MRSCIIHCFVIPEKFKFSNCYSTERFPLQEGFAPLHVASSLGNLEFVNFLINERAKIDAVDAYGRYNKLFDSHGLKRGFFK